jgi:hypothetical protein
VNFLLSIRADASVLRVAPSTHATAPSQGEASRGGSMMSRLTWLSGAVWWAVWLTLTGFVSNPRPAVSAEVAPGFRVDVVATGVPRPIQLALDPRGRLVVLSSGAFGDAAGEIYRLDLRAPLPIDASRVPRVVIPFADQIRKAVLGSLAVDPRSGSVFLGEENGNRIYRLGDEPRLQPVAVGLNHLLGGTALTLDRRGHLVFVDYSGSEAHLRSETPLPPSLSWLVDEGYRGPLVFRIDPTEDRPLPRRADLLIPIFPRKEASRPDREPLWRLIGVTATPGDDLVFLSSVGEVLRLGADGELRLVVRLPAGHYHRTNLTTGPDGSIYVCAGYQIRQIFRISPAGRVGVVASELGDPGGSVLDAKGALYIPEAAVHRIIRIVPDP